jgi:hypothetical protein
MSEVGRFNSDFAGKKLDGVASNSISWDPENRGIEGRGSRRSSLKNFYNK